MNDLVVFLESLIKKTYKALPLRELADGGGDVHLGTYLESLHTTLYGGLSLFKDLGLDGDERYIEVASSISFLKDNDVPYKQYRRTILNSLSIINDLVVKYKGV